MKEQSRDMCVKCQPDGELPMDEKGILAVHISHPAAAHRQIAFRDTIPAVRGKRTTAKEVYFYGKMQETTRHVPGISP